MKICIFGASSTTLDDVYINKTEELAYELAKRGHTLVFGGGANGLMGAAARGFSKGGGKIIGVAPHFFDLPGILYEKCDKFVYPETMRDRKKYMEDEAEAFVVTPGGIGTYEEFFEVLTLKQLARMSKPIALYNINGFFNPIISLFNQNTADGFIRPQTINLFFVSDSAESIINYTENDNLDINSIKFHD